MSGPVDGGGSPGGSPAGVDIAGLRAIFDQAAEDQKEITRASVEGNTRIAASKEKPKI